jgi:PqqD family protein of HPr-rel-A system
LYWRCWADEYVVFDESSGHTHQLDAMRAFVLDVLAQSPCSFEGVLSELASIPATTELPSLSELLTTFLNEFGAHGLVEEISL